MNKKRLLTIISFVFGLVVTACNGTSGNKSNDLELIYFGKKAEKQQQEKALNKKPYFLKNESVSGETLDDGIASLSYGENFVVEAQVKNEKRYSFVDIVISSGSTNQKYVFNEGNGQYQCQTTTVFRDDMWITDITIPIDFSLINKDINDYKCFIDTFLEVEEITFLNLSGGDAKADIKTDVKKLPIKAEGTPDNHVWEMNKLEDGSINIECTSCHKNQYGLQIDTTNKVVRYGAYPQTVVSDVITIGELDALEKPYLNDWYYYNGSFYAKLIANPYDASSKFDSGDPIESGKAYWFKCEPIIWKILSDNNNEYYLFSKRALDNHCYDDDSPIYKDSEIRSWLNNDFYNIGFALYNTSYIKNTDVDNSASTTTGSENEFACENTQDKVFLPSYQDKVNIIDVLTQNEPFEERSADFITTDWATANGSGGNWFTRSPYHLKVFNKYYISDGSGNSGTGIEGGGVRPAITFSLKGAEQKQQGPKIDAKGPKESPKGPIVSKQIV